MFGFTRVIAQKPHPSYALFLDKIRMPLRGETHFVFQAFAVVVCQKAPEL